MTALEEKNRKKNKACIRQPFITNEVTWSQDTLSELP